MHHSMKFFLITPDKRVYFSSACCRRSYRLNAALLYEEVFLIQKHIQIKHESLRLHAR